MESSSLDFLKLNLPLSPNRAKTNPAFILLNLSSFCDNQEIAPIVAGIKINL